MDVPLPAPLRHLVGQRPAFLVLYHLLRNLICGGLASLITWLMYSSGDAGGAATGLTPRIVVASLVSGGAGASVLTTLFASAAKDRVIDNLSDSLHEMLSAQGEDATPRQQGTAEPFEETNA